MRQDYEDGIHPELAQQTGVFQEIMSAGDELMTIGIDPATAAVIVAAVPVTLRVLRMVNELVSAAIDDWKENQRLERKRKELDLDREYGINSTTNQGS